jgi:hypothetical protein
MRFLLCVAHRLVGFKRVFKSSDFRHATQQLVQRDGVVADSDAGRVIVRIRHSGCDRADSQFPDCFGLHRRGHWIRLVQRNDILVRNIRMNDKRRRLSRELAKDRTGQH